MNVNLPVMTGPSLWELMDDLYNETMRIARGWRDAVGTKGAMPIDPETCRKNAEKWDRLAAIFMEARTRIYEAAEEDFKEESCGA